MPFVVTTVWRVRRLALAVGWARGVLGIGGCTGIASSVIGGVGRVVSTLGIVSLSIVSFSTRIGKGGSGGGSRVVSESSVLGGVRFGMLIGMCGAGVLLARLVLVLVLVLVFEYCCLIAAEAEADDELYLPASTPFTASICGKFGIHGHVIERRLQHFAAFLGIIIIGPWYPASPPPDHMVAFRTLPLLELEPFVHGICSLGANVGKLEADGLFAPAQGPGSVRKLLKHGVTKVAAILLLGLVDNDFFDKVLVLRDEHLGPA